MVETTRRTKTSEAIVPVATKANLGTIIGRRISIIVVIAVTTGIVAGMVVATTKVVVASFTSGALSTGNGNPSRARRTGKHAGLVQDVLIYNEQSSHGVGDHGAN